MEFLKRATKIEADVVAMRRYLHEHPELSGQEEATVAFVAAELEKLGIPYVEVPNGGILATLDSGKPGKTLLLRADLDALPVTEAPHNLKGPKAAVSTTPGVMHACGHDAHTAMLLGSARLLCEQRDALRGKIIFMFERGEEGGGNVLYLYHYIDRQKIHIDGSFGIHMYADLASGKISLAPGPVMAGGVMFDVTITGRGGHSSRPDLANNPLDCFYSIYGALSSIRMRNIGPYDTITYSVGLLEGGTRSNILPDSIRFAGSARTFDRERAGQPFRDALERIVKNIAAAYDCDYTFNMLLGPTYAVVNDTPCAELAQRAIGGALGQGAVCAVEPWMASESMATTLALWPGVFALLGTANADKGTGAAHHNAQFDIDDDVLKLGVAGTCAYATEFLQSDIDTSSRRSPLSPIEMLKELKFFDKMGLDALLAAEQ